jgi:hypothetical protein
MFHLVFSEPLVPEVTAAENLLARNGLLNELELRVNKRYGKKDKSFITCNNGQYVLNLAEIKKKHFKPKKNKAAQAAKDARMIRYTGIKALAVKAPPKADLANLQPLLKMQADNVKSDPTFILQEGAVPNRKKVKPVTQPPQMANKPTANPSPSGQAPKPKK